jgi:protein-ribulosamine 3-kinase
MLQSHYQVQFIESIIQENIGKNVLVKDFQFLYCGNFNLAARVITNQGKYFIKWNQGGHEGMFESEAKSMELLRKTGAVRVPQVFGYGKKTEGSYLMLEFIQEQTKSPQYWQHLGQQLAELHSLTNENHGLHFNNYVGSIPQHNEYIPDGIQFFVEKRLKPQVSRAMLENRITASMYEAFDKIYEKLPDYLPNEKPALIHGDLWSGNLMVGEDGLPTLVDPSAYYGLRDAEIAFTTLFGAFDTQFYQAYNEAKPLVPRFKDRLDLYNLYPLLVHINIFGGGYIEAVQKILKKYIA